MSVRAAIRYESSRQVAPTGRYDVEQNLADNGTRGDAVELGLGVEHHAVSEHLTSSGVTKVRPWATAQVLAALVRARAPRTLTPMRTWRAWRVASTSRPM